MKNATIFSLLLVLLHSCSPSNTSLISETQLGTLQATDSITQVASVFAADSIAYERISTGQVVGASVFNKVQKKRLQLKGDLEGNIEVVQVFDSIYKTSKGIGVGKTIKDLKRVYTITQVVPSIKSISIYVKESPLLFLFDRSELPENLKYSFDPIDAVQLPSDAVINQVIISW